MQESDEKKVIEQKKQIIVIDMDKKVYKNQTKKSNQTQKTNNSNHNSNQHGQKSTRIRQKK